jgi:hypothetical protein
MQWHSSGMVIECTHKVAACSMRTHAQQPPGLGACQQCCCFHLLLWSGAGCLPDTTQSGWPLIGGARMRDAQAVLPAVQAHTLRATVPAALITWMPPQ